MMGGVAARFVDRLAGQVDRAGLMTPVCRAAGYARRHAAFQVLTFHRVNDEGDPFFPSIPTAVFARQMELVARTCDVLPLDTLVERAREGRLPRNAVAITFDDGYRDNLTHAAPVLARHGLPATIFLATGFIGTAEVPWFDRMALALKQTRANDVRTPWQETASLATAADRVRVLERALAYFKGVPDDELRREVETLLGTLEVSDQRCFKNLMLTWDEVHALVGLGFSIGAHTVHHPILSRVTAERAWNEIMGSRTMIEAACGHSPKAFAYPNGGPGDYTETVKGLVRDAGFTCAVTTRFGVNTRESSPYELRRGGPWEHDPATFALKLAWYRLAG